MPAFALADDGFLALHDGQVFAASDWCRSIAIVGSIRMWADRPLSIECSNLLPYRRLSATEIVEQLQDD
jgi:hypothetical protein